jgi:UDP-N-acetyl-D-mannosaminuronate dehydrogenase
MPDHVVGRITALLNSRRRAVNGTRIVLLGLTYKANTSDFRESPSIAVAERLESLGADLRGCDPHIPAGFESTIGFDVADFSEATLKAADLVVVLVDHPEFDPAMIAEQAPLVFDAKGLLRGLSFEGELL